MPGEDICALQKALPPGNNFLFPRAQKTPTASGHYFSAQPLGQNKLGSLMSTLSEKALLKRYTNHSLRATSVHLLDSAQVPSRHIITVIGHKSESSLKTYTGNTDCQTKRMMSHTISKGVGLQSGSREPNATAVSSYSHASTRNNLAENIISSLALRNVELESASFDSIMEALNEFENESVDELLKSMEMPVSNKILCENQKKNLQLELDSDKVMCKSSCTRPVVNASNSSDLSLLQALNVLSLEQ